MSESIPCASFRVEPITQYPLIQPSRSQNGAQAYAAWVDECFIVGNKLDSLKVTFKNDFAQWRHKLSMEQAGSIEEEDVSCTQFRHTLGHSSCVPDCLL